MKLRNINQTLNPIQQVQNRLIHWELTTQLSIIMMKIFRFIYQPLK